MHSSKKKPSTPTPPRSYSWRKPLPGEEAESLLSTLWENQALELVFHEGTLLIPYVLNDAAECFLELKDCQMKGSSVEELRAPCREGDSPSLDISHAQEKDRQLLLLRSFWGASCSLWYSKSFLVTNLYQYHRILHNWVSGQEHLRRLVYILGTVYEKQSFLTPPRGESYTNPLERELLPLMELSAFRSFRPAAPEYCGVFPDTDRGYLTALSLAEKAGDAALISALKSYRRRKSLPLLGGLGEKRLRQAFIEAESFYLFLDERITEASLSYPPRNYQGSTLAALQAKQKQAQDYLTNLGYTGSYPDYHKGRDLVRVYEEHPFLAPGMDDLKPNVCFLFTHFQDGKPRRHVENLP